jgi:hypothetical protein
LSDEFFVCHHLPHLESTRAAEGEVDFLVLHRELGLLVLECKGFGIRRSGTGQWSRLEQGGGETPLKESPFEQARRHLHDLVRELRFRLPRALPQLGGTFPFTYGYAVAFPLTLVGEVNTPLDVDRRIVLDAQDLCRIAQRVPEILRFWRGAHPAPSPLAAHEYKRFRRELLHPTIQLAASVGARIQLDREALVRLSHEQVATIQGFAHNRRLRVLSGAGTGKTIVAVEAARTLAAEGRNVLFLCFNNALARHLRDLLEDPDREAAEQSRLFWDVEAPTALVRALEAGRFSRWDAILVDEGQDIDQDWWPIIEDCLGDKAAGSIAVFYDPAQCIFGRPCHIPEYPACFELNTNFRNTRRIVEVVSRLGGIKLQPHPRAPEGAPVGVHAWAGPTKTLAELEVLVRRLVEKEQIQPEQITLLTPHSRPNSLLRDRDDLAGWPLADDPLDRKGSLLHATIGRFKGLESDVVILLDVDPDDPRCGRNERYVAASRAWRRQAASRRPTRSGRCGQATSRSPVARG